MVTRDRGTRFTNHPTRPSLRPAARRPRAAPASGPYLLTHLDLAAEPVELGDDQGVAGAAGGEGIAQAGALAVGAGDAVVDVDPVGWHAEGT